MVDLSPIFNPLLQMLAYAGILIIFIVVAYFIYQYSKYKYTCFIYEKRAEGKSQLVIDKGAFLKTKDGVWFFKLLKRRHTIKPPANKFLWNLGKKNFVHFRHMGSDLYEPFNPVFPTEKEENYLQELDYDETLSWKVNMADRLKKTLDAQTIWEKYGLMIISFIAFFATIVTIYLLLKFARGTIGDLVGAVREQTGFFQNMFSSFVGGGEPPPG